MGTYARYKEDLERARFNISALELEDLKDGEKKEAFDRWNKLAKVAEAKIRDYGAGKVFRFKTPKGIFYMVNIDSTDIPELMRDIGIGQYFYTEMNAKEIIKL